MLIGPQNLLSRLTEVRSRIRNAATEAGRDPAGITLVAVTKTKPAAMIREAAAHGVTDFGENYLQEAAEKMAELADLPLESETLEPGDPDAEGPFGEWLEFSGQADALPLASSHASAMRHSPPANDGTATGVWRILDAAANRAGEGLRVVEDFVRMVLDDRHLTELCKALRHDLTSALSALPYDWRATARDTQADVGADQAGLDVAHALASPDFRFVTGQIICVDGGFNAHAPHVGDSIKPLARD